MARIINVKYNEQPAYDIVITDSYDLLKDNLLKLGADKRKLCIVTETNVSEFHLAKVKFILDEISDDVVTFVFEAGEKNKNLKTVESLYEKLIMSRFDRKDMLLALGGGVVGDLTGYAAATYLRGIDFVQLPTSLLSQVDSSIGGKTGVDFNAYKNMVGAFHQPKLVYMNLKTLDTLERREYLSGMGEIIKHGLIKDRSYYEFLKDNYEAIKNREYDALEEMIYRSCNIKREVVENDPKEKGDRALLNFGHTLGHAIEKQMNFSLLHGECVILGMIAASEISYQRNLITKEELDDIMNTIRLYEFTENVSGITVEEVIEASKNDKKMVGKLVKFILLKEVGQAYIDMTVTDEEMRHSLESIIV